MIVPFLKGTGLKETETVSVPDVKTKDAFASLVETTVERTAAVGRTHYDRNIANSVNVVKKVY